MKYCLTPKSSRNVARWQAEAFSSKQMASQETYVAQSGIIPYRNKGKDLEVLLITSVGSGRWILPKGHIEDGMSPRESATKEALEEAGVNGTVSTKKIGDYTYSKKEKKNGPIYKVDIYAMHVNFELEIWPEEGKRQRKWMPIQEAIKSVNEKGLRSVIRHFSELMGK